MRTPLQGFAEKMAWVLNQTERPVPVLNGGSGPDQHPTQALLDIYTLEREFRNTGGLALPEEMVSLSSVVTPPDKTAPPVLSLVIS